MKARKNLNKLFGLQQRIQILKTGIWPNIQGFSLLCTLLSVRAQLHFLREKRWWARKTAPWLSTMTNRTNGISSQGKLISRSRTFISFVNGISSSSRTMLKCTLLLVLLIPALQLMVNLGEFSLHTVPLQEILHQGKSVLEELFYQSKHCHLISWHLCGFRQQLLAFTGSWLVWHNCPFTHTLNGH